MNRLSLQLIDDSWADDTRDVLRSAVGGDLAERLLEPLEQVELAFGGGDQYVAPRPIDPKLARQWPSIANSLDNFRHQLWVRIGNYASEFDPAYLLGGAAALSQFAVQIPHHAQVPGRFDHEIDTIATATHWVGSSRKYPVWEDIATGLRMARMWRTATVEADQFRRMQVELSGNRADKAKADLRSATLRYWNNVGTGTYPLIAHEIVERLLILLPTKVASIVSEASPQLFYVFSNIDGILRSHTNHLLSARSDSQFDDAVDQFTDKFDVGTAAQLLCSSEDGPGDDLETRFLWDPTDSRADHYENPLLARPFMTLNGASMLVFIRRLTTELLDFLDRAIMFACRTFGRDAESRYAGARAAMLDRLVSEVLADVLPGSEVYNNVIPLEASGPERDVICRYEDVALAIETKGAPFKESALRGSASLIEELRKKSGEGARQAVKSADALQSNVGLRRQSDGSLIPPATIPPRKVYAACVSFASPWPVDVRVRKMQEAGVIQNDNVCFTTIDKLVLMRTLFSQPQEFLAYFDFRLSVQRRPWFRLPDEYEVAGFFCNQTHSEWLTTETTSVLTGIYQPAFNAYVSSLVRGGSRSTPRDLQRHDVPLVARFVRHLCIDKPDRWLMAASAALRTPLDVQQWLDESTKDAMRLLGSRPYRRMFFGHGVAALTLIAAGPSYKDSAFQAAVTKASRSAYMAWVISVAPFTHTIVAIRGVDDEEYWWSI